MASALDTEASAPPVGPRHRSLPSWPRRPAVFDAVLAAVLALATLFVHSIHYVLSQTFWLDEAWVAVSTRVPLRQVPHVTSVTPLGWTLLLRGSHFGGRQDLRLLPLGFSVLSVAVAYLIGRSLPWGALWWRRVVGTLTALAVLLAPSSLARNDLKPYTADAFVTLSVLLLVGLLEAQWSRKRLAVLAGACVVGFTISTVAPFVTAAAFGSLLVVALVRRNWRRLVEVAVAGAATAVVLGGIYVLAYQSHVQKNLTQFWKDFYPPISKGIGPTLHYLHFRGNEMASYLGMGPLIVALVLVAAGVVTIARSGRPSLAFATPILLLEMIVAGAAKKYPLFDQRTSYFLTVCFAVFAAVGVAGLCSLLVRSQRPARRRCRGGRRRGRCCGVRRQHPSRHPRAQHHRREHPVLDRLRGGLPAPERHHPGRRDRELRLQLLLAVRSSDVAALHQLRHGISDLVPGPAADHRRHQPRQERDRRRPG